MMEPLVEGRRKRWGLTRLMKACWAQPAYEGEIPSPETSPETSPTLVALPDDVLLECLARLPRTTLQSSMMVCHKWRCLLRSPEFYDQRKKIGKLESMLFVLGGSGTGLACTVYSKNSGVWNSGLLFSSRAVLDNEWLLDYHSSEHSLLHAQPAVLRHRIFILGAVPSSSSKCCIQDCTIVYDSWTKSLERKAPMLCPRKKFAFCVIDDRILVAGGARRKDYSRDAIVDAEIYDPTCDKWSPIASMPRKRYGCLGVAVDGVFYVIGGLKFGNVLGFCKQPYTYVGSMESFDPKTNSWQKTKPLPMGGCVIACTVVGSCIYMLSSHAVELSFWKYDTRNDSWTKIKPPPIPSPLRMDKRMKFSCVTIGPAVYVIQVSGSIDDLLIRSGRNGRGLTQGLVLIYHTRWQEWSRGLDLPFIKNGAACAVVEC